MRDISDLRLASSLLLLTALASSACQGALDPAAQEADLKQSVGDLAGATYAVLDPWVRTELFRESCEPKVTYTTGPNVDFPVMPVQAFGVTYDLDLVMTSDHPDWNMHEYARILTQGGAVWLAKDSRQADLSQTIVADLPNIETFLPEVEVERHAGRVDVLDLSRDTNGDKVKDALDISLDYINADGERVQANFVGDSPSSTMVFGKRNSPTMGHSAGIAMVVLDLNLKTMTMGSRIKVNGIERGNDSLFGRNVPIFGAITAPVQASIQQTQAGFSTGSFTQARGITGLYTEHRGYFGSPIPQGWDILTTRDGIELRTFDDFRTLRYQFVQNGSAQELERIVIEQYGHETPSCTVRFSPRLPDVRRGFTGVARSRFVIDVNGQESHGLGTVTVSSNADGAILDIIGEEPSWIVDRPMRSIVNIASGRATTTVQRVD